MTARPADLADKVVLVSGGSRGVGAAVALWLLRRPPAVRVAALAVSFAGLAAVSGEVASWGWVA